MAGGGNVKMKPIRASLPFQIVLYFNAWYFAIFFFVEIGLLIWKAVILPYPMDNFAAEVVLVFIVVCTAALQIRSGQQGNLTERVTSSVASFLLLAPVFFGVIYFLLWQTYVFYIDVVIVAIELAFIALELVFSLVCMITFCRAPSQSKRVTR